MFRLSLLILFCAYRSSCLLAAEVLVQTNLQYGTGAVNASSVPATKNLLLDLYRPVGEGSTNGCALVLVHGGSFISGDSGSLDMVDAGRYFAARGWTCLSINYRLAGDDPPLHPALTELTALERALILNQFPTVNATHAAVVDTRRAIRWLRVNADLYGIDTKRLAVLGHSAGAYAVLMAAIADEKVFANDAGTTIPDQNPSVSSRPNACVEVSGTAGTDIGLGFGDYRPEITPDDPPIMIWHGTVDNTVPYEAAEQISAACKAQLVPHWLIPLPGIDHGAATWLASSEGRGIKETAEDFLGRFFLLRLDGEGQALTWPSVSNAVYRLRSTDDLFSGFTNLSTEIRIEGPETSILRTNQLPFVSVEILSGQR